MPKIIVQDKDNWNHLHIASKEYDSVEAYNNTLKDDSRWIGVCELTDNRVKCAYCGNYIIDDCIVKQLIKCSHDNSLFLGLEVALCSNCQDNVVDEEKTKALMLNFLISLCIGDNK